VAVDFAATATRSFPLDALVGTAARTAAELAGGVRPPAVEVVLDRPRADGRPVSSGHRADAEEQRDFLLGPRPLPPGSDRAIDLLDGEGRDVVFVFESPAPGDWRVVASPVRAAPAIVWGLSVAVATALLGEGRVVSDDLRLFPPEVEDPREIVALTRLPASEGSFGDAATAFLRQFEHLGQWP
jgi:hypothetical protein